MGKILCFSAVLLFFAVGVESFMNEGDVINYRLPNDTIPIHYDVDIFARIGSEDDAFNGTVKITLKVIEDTKSIVLHARQLTVDFVRILDEAKVIDCTADYSEGNTTEFLTITPENELCLPKGKELILEIVYKGNFRRDIEGFYVTAYTSTDGEERWLAGTQFESTNARQAFPCYDEPAKKATFNFSLTHGKTFNAIFNTEPIGEPVPIEGTELVTTFFKQTPPMSTYIIAFIISDLAYSEIVFRGLKQRIYSRPSPTKGHEDLALITSALMIYALDEYFQIEFQSMVSIAKLDQIAIPKDGIDAVENWGLVAYAEKNLLYRGPSAQAHINFLDLMGHEGVHQWFGNYVSVEWWTYLWLKEALAHYYSNFMNDKVCSVTPYPH